MHKVERHISHLIEKYITILVKPLTLSVHQPEIIMTSNFHMKTTSLILMN